MHNESTTVAPPIPSQIYAELDTLADQIELLDTVVNQLVHKLHPVSRELLDKAGAAQVDGDALVPLANTIRTLRLRLDVLKLSLQDICNSIEL